MGPCPVRVASSSTSSSWACPRPGRPRWPRSWPRSSAASSSRATRCTPPQHREDVRRHPAHRRGPLALAAGDRGPGGRQARHEGTSTVVTCSALKRAYRDVLRNAAPTFFVHLDAPFEVLRAADAAAHQALHADRAAALAVRHPRAARRRRGRCRHRRDAAARRGRGGGRQRGAGALHRVSEASSRASAGSETVPLGVDSPLVSADDDRAAHAHEVVQGADVAERADLGEPDRVGAVRPDDPGVQVPAGVGPGFPDGPNSPGGGGSAPKVTVCGAPMPAVAEHDALPAAVHHDAAAHEAHDRHAGRCRRP